MCGQFLLFMPLVTYNYYYGTRFHLTRGGCQHDLIYTVFRALYTH